MVRELQAQYAAAVAHRGMVLAARTATTQREDRLSRVGQLAEVARERLEHADAELRARVFALLDVRVTVLSTAGRAGRRGFGSRAASCTTSCSPLPSVTGHLPCGRVVAPQVRCQGQASRSAVRSGQRREARLPAALIHFLRFA